MIREDYILRIIKQAMEAIARMVGASKREDFQDARAQAGEAYDVLGVPAELALRMDSVSLAGLLKHPEKIRVFAELSWQEGELFRATGDPINGLDRQRRAVELMLEAHRIEPLPDDDAKLQEMFRHVPTGTLHERYRSGKG